MLLMNLTHYFLFPFVCINLRVAEEGKAGMERYSNYIDTDTSYSATSKQLAQYVDEVLQRNHAKRQKLELDQQYLSSEEFSKLR